VILQERKRKSLSTADGRAKLDVASSVAALY